MVDPGSFLLPVSFNNQHSVFGGAVCSLQDAKAEAKRSSGGDAGVFPASVFLAVLVAAASRAPMVGGGMPGPNPSVRVGLPVSGTAAFIPEPGGCGTHSEEPEQGHLGTPRVRRAERSTIGTGESQQSGGEGIWRG